MRRSFALLFVFYLAASPAWAQKDEIPEPECDGSTTQMVECVASIAERWDKRLNAAYQKALKDAVSTAQRDQLRAAQRLWVRYRDANCEYYALGEGTISRLEAASCLHDVTKSRALELEGGGKN